MTRVPAHAGSLRLSERLAFVLMFMTMAAFVVGLSVLAAKFGGRAVTTATSSANSRTDQVGRQGQQSLPLALTPASGLAKHSSSAQRNAARLSAALRSALGSDRTRLSVGVEDTATGATALYQSVRHYDTASIAGTDILEALLYQHQAAGTSVSNLDRRLAARMIENGSGAATARLWRAIGRAPGLLAANRALGLQDTMPGTGYAWRLTTTTVTDQLQLLATLAADRSALTSADRQYAIGLMAKVTAPAQRFGVPAAASRDMSSLVSDGCLEISHRWVVNSIGVIPDNGHDLLVVVLSQGWLTKAQGITAVRLAAIAAAGVLAASH